MAVISKRLRIAEEIASRHKTVDPFVLRVFLLQSKSDEKQKDPLKLLEVVDGTPERGIDPVYFAPDRARGVPFPLVIVEISPAEFQKRGKRPIRVNGDVWEFASELAKP